MDYQTNCYYECRRFSDQDGGKDHDSGLGESDQWRFTPSMLDTNSFTFTSFANQHCEGFSPTPGGALSSAFHNQAGDLHTPGVGFGLETPLSLSNSDGQNHSALPGDMHGFHPHLLQSQSYQSQDVFSQQQQQSYAPSSFVHQDSGYETLHNVQHPLSGSQVIDSQHQPHFSSHSAQTSERIAMQSNQNFEKFRYQVTLNAPTAMIKHSDEIPITYLNKGQAYWISICDSMGLGSGPGPIKYRTVIRISFEDEQQRQRPSACWQLWKEGRGLVEAHQRGGKLQAVEYVDPNQSEGEHRTRPRVELERASFDCFSVTWSPVPGSSTAECSVAVRFNFLSTDFSHSKGVKGIPVRFCAKTEIISSGTPNSPPGPTSEVSFCKVKLFRDHGAERKLSNDIAHIKKTIDKLKQQIVQVENGVKEIGKRKRSAGDKGCSHRPGKVHKHKRTWSVSSQGSSGRPAMEEDLHMKLATMQDMFTSTRPASVLHLKGDAQDDPDLYPVALPGESSDLTKIGQLDRRISWDHKTQNDSTPTSSCVVSPSPSPRSAHSDPRPSEQATTFNTNQQMASNEWEQLTNFVTADSSSHPDSSKKVQKGNNGSSLSDWIDAFEVDPSYKAPAEGSAKPIACFYVLIRSLGGMAQSDYYRAVYLMDRTLEDLIAGIAVKCGVDPAQVTNTLRINPKGLKIMVDNEVVRELPEGQDMIVEFAKINPTSSLKQEAGSGESTPKATDTSTSTSMQALEMCLLF